MGITCTFVAVEPKAIEWLQAAPESLDLFAGALPNKHLLEASRREGNPPTLQSLLEQVLESTRESLKELRQLNPPQPVLAALEREPFRLEKEWQFLLPAIHEATDHRIRWPETIDYGTVTFFDPREVEAFTTSLAGLDSDRLRAYLEQVVGAQRREPVDVGAVDEIQAWLNLTASFSFWWDSISHDRLGAVAFFA